ncbi:AI-2E family transporter [Sulfitobacter donghicola]|uniref:Membrane protein n=1 Tax=Sulfitobacter donghicola DSW-25 = KCTC 12864 = JCM 14565 TaxID=1300350 RepID=A0A073IK25_9RHOB|nr:AI-2E family transporter [Sulfitobacter donghicola]KEJ89930.1 membrane protein [Sulfitobacter donghicola DSW-25 = KCTC 12864 = JCM 14565]KIN66945.1 Membrane protein [Sulfitobacter donghicola DSW-25 = KCTC 12864 = JCM 14565]
MALPIKDQMKYWGIASAVVLVVLWFLGDVLLPFVLGSAIAYFLDPVADRLERMGLSRAMATALITIIALLIFVIMALLVIPTLVEQAINLFQIAPDLASRFGAFLTERFPALLEEGSTLQQSIQSIGATIQERGGELLNTALSSAAGILNLMMLLVIVPVVAVYMLLDWDRMISQIDALLPRDHAPVIRQLARSIDKTLASFIRGMGTVCLVLGTYYAIALMLVGLQFGLVVGFVAGLVTFIPYLGALIGGALAIGLALFQFWGEWVSIGMVAGIFVFGQIIEGNVLTPKLVGNSVGLHPVWLILALAVFGTLFGFVGMLVAVPVAASLGVIARFGIDQYRQSLLYHGTTHYSVAPTDKEAE